MLREFSVKTGARTDFVDITAKVEEAVSASGVTGGVCVVYVPHTTAAVTINENADPSVTADMAHAMDRAVPWDDPAYAHMEGNTAAHVKSSLFGCSETVPVGDGRLALGTWQGIYLCEFDGPRTRRVIVRVFS